MESDHANRGLAALAHEARLAAFRALVEAGPEGAMPSLLSDRLGIPAPTLSFHLAQLKNAGLVSVRRTGRSLHYAADYAAMNALVGYLTENCCAGSACAPSVCAPTAEGVPHEAPARSRRR